MNNNSLYCPDCNGHHHPMSCPLELSKGVAMEKPEKMKEYEGMMNGVRDQYECGFNQALEEYDQWILGALGNNRDLKLAVIDLLKQATTEKSHYYTASLLKRILGYMMNVDSLIQKIKEPK